MSLFIIFEGGVHSPDDIYISVEQEILLKINGGHTSALTMLLLRVPKGGSLEPWIFLLWSPEP